MSLILSTQCDFETVQNVPTPEATNTHYPLAHAEAFNRLYFAVQRNGLSIIDIEHSLSTNEQRYYGVMRIQDTTSKSLLIGVRNAHDKSSAYTMIGGSYLKVCSNGWFFGEYRLSRKHTKNLTSNLDAFVADALYRLELGKHKDAVRDDVYRNTQLSKRDCDHLLIESLRMKALPASKIPDVLRTYDRPTHEEYGENTLYTLFQSYTQVAKTFSVDTLVKRTMRLQGLFDSFSLASGNDALSEFPEANIIDVVPEINPIQDIG